MSTSRAVLAWFSTGPDLPETGADVDARYRSIRVRVMVAITLGYALIYTCRLALGVVKKPLIDAGVFSPTDLEVMRRIKLAHDPLDLCNPKKIFPLSMLTDPAS